MRDAADLSNIIYGQDYIRYDRLYSMTMHAFAGQPEGNSDLVNIFVDVNSMLQFMYTSMPYHIGDYTCITASMVNLCAHLKAYFWTRHLTTTKIYLVYGDNNPQIPGRTIPGYNGHYLTAVEAKKELQPLVNSSMDLLNILMPYVNGAYFIRGTNVETAAIIYDMIMRLKNQVGHYGPVPNIIYTRDSFDYQLVALCPRTFIYRPRKSQQNGDMSFDITKTTLLHGYREHHHLSNMPDLEASIPFYMLPFIMAIGGLKGRDIKGVSNITNAMKMIATNPRKTSDDVRTLLTIGEEVPAFWANLGCGAVPETCMANLKAINLIGHAQDLQARDHQVMYQNVVDLYDPDGFKEINNKYFINYPLDVERL